MERVFAKLLPILGITFIDILGFSILIPILPYYVKHFGASTVAVGVLFAVFALCQFVAGPLWGNVSDRIGRKAVLIISQIGATIGWAMLAFAPTLGWVFVARAIEGASGGNISVTQAYVADRVEPWLGTLADDVPPDGRQKSDALDVEPSPHEQHPTRHAPRCAARAQDPDTKHACRFQGQGRSRPRRWHHQA